MASKTPDEVAAKAAAMLKDTKIRSAKATTDGEFGRFMFALFATSDTVTKAGVIAAWQARLSACRPHDVFESTFATEIIARLSR